MSYAPTSRYEEGERRDESTGQITSDSLAAESLRDGGDYGANRDTKAYADPVSSYSTTANNQDDSSATVLPSARDKQERLTSGGAYDPTGPAGYEGAYSSRSGRDNDDEGGYSSRSGRGNDYDDNKSSSYGRGNDDEGTYSSRSGRGNNDDDDNKGSSYGRSTGGYDNAPERSANEYDTSRGGPQESYGGDAPSAYGADDQSKYKPGGRNIREGGFDDSAPNASFNSMREDQEPGSRRDPGRVGLQQVERENARSGYDSGYSGSGNPRGDSNEDSGYGNLRRDEDA